MNDKHEANPADFMSQAEALRRRNERTLIERGVENIDDLTPMDYAEMTGDTSRLSPGERQRFYERRLERLSGYRE